MKKLVEVLKSHEFQAEYFESPAELVQRVLQIIPPQASVGMGGSVTVRQLGLPVQLAARGNELFELDARPDLSRQEVRDGANRADFYLTSANAITQDGTIINIDGICNRIGSICYGPGTVIFLIGKNKLTKDILHALTRIKSEACPKNAVRLGLSTPCALTGGCTNCNSRERMCRGTLVLERPPRDKDVYVFLINQDYGY